MLCLSSCGITLYQFTEHYITNANTVPMLILCFLYDFRGTWQADKQRLSGRLIRCCAACGWLVNVPALPTNPCQPTLNQGRIKRATHTAGQAPLLWQSLFQVVNDLTWCRQKAKSKTQENKNTPVSGYVTMSRFIINIAEIKMQLHILFTESTIN